MDFDTAALPFVFLCWQGGATGTVDFLARHTQWDPSPLTNVERLNTK